MENNYLDINEYKNQNNFNIKLTIIDNIVFKKYAKNIKIKTLNLDVVNNLLDILKIKTILVKREYIINKFIYIFNIVNMPYFIKQFHSIDDIILHCYENDYTNCTELSDFIENCYKNKSSEKIKFLIYNISSNKLINKTLIINNNSKYEELELKLMNMTYNERLSILPNFKLNNIIINKYKISKFFKIPQKLNTSNRDIHVENEEFKIIDFPKSINFKKILKNKIFN